MALGDFKSNNDNNKKKFVTSAYSAYSFPNPDSSIDCTRLSASYFNKLLKITIEPKKQNSNAEYTEWDRDGGMSVFLSHTKARLLYNAICDFQENPDKYNNVGVPSGQGLISISNGKELGENKTCLILRKITEEGEVESTFVYEFKTASHYTIANFNSNNTKDYNKVYDSELEIEQFKTLLLQYYQAMTNAIGYSVVDSLNFEFYRTNAKLDNICEKLGIEYKGKYSNKKSSYFDSNEPKQNFNSGSIDDLV